VKVFHSADVAPGDGVPLAEALVPGVGEALAEAVSGPTGVH
jgi:hypothetical protein